MQYYIGIIHKDADSDYGVSFPDFPGCISAGSTKEELRLMAHEALQGHIDMMVEYGDALPQQPMTLDEVTAHEDAQDAVMFMDIGVFIPYKRKKIHINVDEALLDSIKKSFGSNRSEFFNIAARDYLERM